MDTQKLRYNFEEYSAAFVFAMFLYVIAWWVLVITLFGIAAVRLVREAIV